MYMSMRFYVIATGKSFSIKDVFLKILGKKLFKKKIIFDNKLTRANEINSSYANIKKIKKKLNWKPKYTVIDLFRNNV